MAAGFDTLSKLHFTEGMGPMPKQPAKATRGCPSSLHGAVCNVRALDACAGWGGFQSVLCGGTGWCALQGGKVKMGLGVFCASSESRVLVRGKLPVRALKTGYAWQTGTGPVMMTEW
eukprot:1147155-Pelagomonas_calceolata.AAC.4